MSLSFLFFGSFYYLWSGGIGWRWGVGFGACFQEAISYGDCSLASFLFSTFWIPYDQVAFKLVMEGNGKEQTTVCYIHVSQVLQTHDCHLCIKWAICTLLQKIQYLGKKIAMEREKLWWKKNDIIIQSSSRMSKKHQSGDLIAD